MFLSSKSAVDSGAHWATESLHKIDWPSDGNLPETTNIVDVVRLFGHLLSICPYKGSKVSLVDYTLF